MSDFSQSLDEEWRGRRSTYKEVYTIQEEAAERYLNAKSHDQTNFIIKKVSVDLVEYPYLNWSWRIHQLPESGDESVKSYCDVAASMAVVLNKSRILPKSIKYSWSATLPKDHFTQSPFATWPARCDIHVVASGEEDLGVWRHEKVNVLEDYKRFYNKEKVKSKKIHAFVVMTDSDNTGSSAEADYNNIYFSKK